MNKKELTLNIKELSHALGFDLVGISQAKKNIKALGPYRLGVPNNIKSIGPYRMRAKKHYTIPRVLSSLGAQNTIKSLGLIPLGVSEGQ